MLISKLLGIKCPTFQGAVADVATPGFTAAVSNCGTLGIITTGAMDEHQTWEAIRTCRWLADKPFNVNVMLMNPHIQVIIQVTCKEQVAVVTTGVGNPGSYIPALKKSGYKMIPIVANVALVHRLERSGVDAIIAEGGESGSYVGETTTMSLIPQVVDAVSIPVLAAGGITNGRQLNAAPCPGAVGVQVGTCLLLAEECPVHENYKRAIMEVKDMDSIVTGRSTGTPVRILKNQMALQHLKLEQGGADKEEIEKLTLGGLRRAVQEGDMYHGSVMMGQIAGTCKDIHPLQDILDSLIREGEGEAVALQQAVKELCYK